MKTLEKLTWSTTKRRVKDLLPYEKNPRRLTPEQAEQLKTSIEKFNLAEIPAVDIDGRIVAGHQRVATLKLLGRGAETIDVRIPNRKLTAEEFQEYNLRSNKNTGEWDFEALMGNFPEELLKTVGFDLSEFPEVEVTYRDGQDDVPPMRETDITVGEAFTLGDHILICGDSTNFETLHQLGACEMAFTDPPWNVAIGQDNVPTHKKRQAMKNDALGKAFPDFLVKVSACLQKFVKGDLYCVMGCGEWPAVHAALTGAKFHWSSSIVWIKDSFVMGRHNYHTRFEPIWYGWQKTSSYRGDRKQDDVWEFARPKKSPEHPTMKPVELVERAILNSSVKGDKVLDLFGGSGTTLIACEKTGRRGRLVELEPGYCQVIIDRWENFTGKKARKVSHG